MTVPTRQPAAPATAKPAKAAKAATTKKPAMVAKTAKTAAPPPARAATTAVAAKTAKAAKFPGSTTLGGLAINGRVHVALDGSEALYGDAAAVARLRRGEKQLTRLPTDACIAGVAALGGGLTATAINGDDAPRIDIYGDDNSIVGVLALPAGAYLTGCTAGPAAFVAWGRASEDATSLTLWWWPLPTTGAAIVTTPTARCDIATDAIEATWVGAQLCLASDTRLWLATTAGAVPVPLPRGMEPRALSGCAADRILFRSSRRFVVLQTDGALVQELPPVLKVARLSPDGRRVIGYGEGHSHTTPADVRDRFPEWERDEFLASFDVDSGERIAWTKSKVLDGLAVIDDDTVVTVALKGLGFVPWPV